MIAMCTGCECQNTVLWAVHGVSPQLPEAEENSRQQKHG